VAADGDLYQIVDVQRLDNQVCLNVYFYKRNAPVLVGNPAQQVADAFDASVIPAIADVQSPSLVHEELRVQNLFDASDSYTKLISEAGTGSASDTATPFDALGLRLVQDNGAIRNGSKRLAGVTDGMASQGILNDSATITALIAAGVAMVAGVDIGIVANAITPVIIQRILDAGRYRLPANSGEAVYGNITDALYNVDVTSQVSRKYGRGE
jgi:hypothetical protein